MKNKGTPHACGAKTRFGRPCKNNRMPNGRCRMHGGKSTGARTPEGLQRISSANWKHGAYSKEHSELWERVQQIKERNRDFLADLKRLAAENPDALRRGGLMPDLVLAMRELPDATEEEEIG